MARVPDLKKFCKKHGLVMITVAELARYRVDLDFEGAMGGFHGIYPSCPSLRKTFSFQVIRDVRRNYGAGGMIHTHSLGRAARYYPEKTAVATAGRRSNFRELHDRVGRIAAAMRKLGFEAGDRLAILLPNESEYLELVHACAWLGVVVVPLNIRLSATEIDHILSDATPRGLVRHSSLPMPTVQPPLQRVLDQEPLDIPADSYPEAIYDPEAVLVLIYTSGTTGRPKGVMLSHENILATVNNTNYWLPYKEGGVYLHAAPMFHVADFPLIFAAPAFGACQVTIAKFSRSSLLRNSSTRTSHSHGPGAYNDQSDYSIRGHWEV